jgi:TfoX/Sxy family transcriptional regulator of competence genes
MAYDEELANRIREALSGRPAAEKKMFGGLAFLVGGHMSVSVSRQGGLLVHVDPAQTDDLLAEPGAEPFEMRGRGPMNGWVRVKPDVLDDDDTLSRWVDRGVGYASTLPPK